MNQSYFEQQKNTTPSVGVVSAGIWKIPHLSAFFPSAIDRLNAWRTPSQHVQWITAWGYRPSRRAAVRYARRHQLSLLTL